LIKLNILISSEKIFIHLFYAGLMLNNSIAEYFEKEGEQSIIGNNTPLLLRGEDNVWLIKSGSVDVFSVSVDGDEQKGARIFLFSVKAGDILMGMNISPDVSERGFLAVGNTNVALYKTSISKLKNFISGSDNFDSFANLADKWILSVSAGIARDSSLRYDLSIEKNNLVSIPGNKKIRARKGVLWLKINSDYVTLLDSDLSSFEKERYFPITDNSWLMTLKPFESECLTSKDLLKDESFWGLLSFYHEQIMILEELNVRMMLVDDFVRNKEKIEILKKIDYSAFTNIAGILDPNLGVNPELKSKDTLIETCKIICGHIGIKLIEPPHNKDKKTDLNEIAQFSKFGFRQISLINNWYQNDSGAILAFTKEKKNAAALIPNFAGRYRIVIPAERIDEPLTPELAAGLEETAFVFYKPLPLKTITPVELLKFIFQTCKKEFILLFAAGSLGGLLTLFTPFLTGIIIDDIIPRADINKMYGFGLSLILSAFALLFAQIVRSISYLRLDATIDVMLQSALWDRLINLPVSFFKKYSSGELAAKANSIAALKMTLTYSVINTVIYNFFMIFNLLLLFYYDPMLGFLSAAIFVLYLILIGFIGIKIKNRNFVVIKLENSIASLVNQLLNSIAKIKIAGTANLAFKLWTDKYAVKQKESLFVKKDSNLIVILNSIFPVIALIFIYYLFTLNRYSEFSVGMLLSFLTAFNVFLISLMQVSASSISFFSAIPLYDNAKEILYTLPEYSQSKEAIKDLKGEIEISHAFYRYEKEGDYVLSDISMTINPGEFVAIVGASGSGKSTLLRLLLGFDTPEKGAVYFDKQNIESIDKSNLRRRIGTVVQNSKLFPGNIYSNIAGVNNFSLEQVNEVIKLVGLDEDLKTMPMGVYTIVNEGLSTLSGGQRQKILLAKALIAKPAILLLDEATSALDNESQNVISENIAKIQTTRIIVAHRLTTIKEADRIYVLEQGKVAECGNYEELMLKNGIFADLVKRQLTDE